MRLLGICAIVLAVISTSSIEASARHHHGGYHRYYTSIAYWRHRHAAERRVWRHHVVRTYHPRWARKSTYDRGQIVAHPSGCPWRLFCGCGASIEAFGHSVRDLWLVSNWYRFPRAAPADGMAVIWGSRHVAIIRHYLGNGVAILYDANSGGHLTRVHRVNIGGLAVVNPHAGKRRAELVKWAAGAL